MTRERVGIVRVDEQRLDEALERLVGLLGGFEGIVPLNSRVLIKPNFVFPPTDRGVTHPQLVEAVVRFVADRGIDEILIGEGSADVYTSQGFRFQGMDLVAARYGAKVVDLNLEEGIRTPVPDGLGRDYIMVPRAVAESDVLISLPVFKLWGGSPLSLSLKNLIGLYGARYYGHNKDSLACVDDLEYAIAGDRGRELGAHQPNVAMSICAMNSVVRTHLAIIDALEGSDGGGHWIRLDTLIGGTNSLATDTVACQMAGVTAGAHEAFRLAEEYGLGPCVMDQIEVVGEKIEDVSFDLERLRDNVLEMPVDFCLHLLNTGELGQIRRALNLWLIQSFGWRWGYAILGLCVWLTVMPLLAFLFRNKPEDVGQRPDGLLQDQRDSVLEHRTDARKAEEDERRFTLSEALRTRAYWIMAVAAALPAMIVTGIHFHAVQIYLDSGLTEADAAVMLTEAGQVADVNDLGDFIVLVIEARESAGQYLRQIASHYPEAAAVRLREAGNAYDREVEYLVELGLLFPDRGVPKVDLEDPQARKEVSKLIQEVYTREKRAVENLEEALAVISAAE